MQKMETFQANGSLVHWGHHTECDRETRSIYQVENNLLVISILQYCREAVRQNLLRLG